MDTRIYREPPRTNAEPSPHKASSVALVASLIACATTFVGFGVVIAIKRIHAAWKKRHDAKLMIEWERRLEEMK
ncbi:MAG TPA: hypothetical protein VH054_18910 [Polyangiaceae bacterium]|jgi:hypothetical protein|nr:hypothetical protein [Polyangiaceae bacterium]